MTGFMLRKAAFTNSRFSHC